jgi:hypothetical protein
MHGCSRAQRTGGWKSRIRRPHPVLRIRQRQSQAPNLCVPGRDVGPQLLRSSARGRETAVPW